MRFANFPGRIFFAEVHRVEATWGVDDGNFGGGGGIHAGGAGGEHSSDEFVRPLGGGQGEHAGDHAGLDERFHRFATCAGGGEDEHFVASALDDAFRIGDAGGGVAKHAGDD